MRQRAIRTQGIFWRGTVSVWVSILGLLLASCIYESPKTPTPGAPFPTAVTPGNIAIRIMNAELAGTDRVLVRVLNTDRLGLQVTDSEYHIQFCGDGQYINAWAPGYYIATQACRNGQTSYEFTLTPYHVQDETGYVWVEARFSGQERSCEPCHVLQAGGRLEYREWQRDGHSRVFLDDFFWPIYLGMDVNGNRNPDTTWIITDNSRHTRVRPEPGQPYYGPGFKTDFPTDGGSCAFCHAPASVTGPQAEVDLSAIITSAHTGQPGAATEGVTCDVCHKVLNVRLDTNNKPYPDKPGVLSFDFVREEPDWKRLYVGPLASTNTIGTAETSQIGVTCSPIFSQSQFCAPCHYGQFWGTQIYNAYGEWLVSPYAKADQPESYRTCQSCHMLAYNPVADEYMQVAAINRKACSKRNPFPSDFSHNMLQRNEQNVSALIPKTATLKLQARRSSEKTLEVEVTAMNVKAGHNFPTDSPLRHLVLYVDVRDEYGTILPQINGPRIPTWGGVGTTLLDFSGKPGEIYANILMDIDTNQAPSVSYWNPTRAVWDDSDTRLKPFDPRISRYQFAMPATGSVSLRVYLYYRYAFIDIARQKGWNVPDVEVAVTEVCTMDLSQPATWECTKASK